MLLFRTAEITKSHFAEIYKFRDTLGKAWIAPKAYFREDKSLYMPNIYGRTLNNSEKRGTTSVLSGKLSIVRIFTSLTGERQADSYFYPSLSATNGKNSSIENKSQLEKALHEAAISVQEDGFQVVDINLPENFAKEFIVGMFIGKIKSQFSQTPGRADRYFIARKGISKELTAAIHLENKYTGYLYIVDKNCKIRWAACGQATDEERDSLWRVIASLKKEN